MDLVASSRLARLVKANELANSVQRCPLSSTQHCFLSLMTAGMPHVCCRSGGTKAGRGGALSVERLGGWRQRSIQSRYPATRAGAHCSLWIAPAASRCHGAGRGRGSARRQRHAGTIGRLWWYQCSVRVAGIACWCRNGAVEDANASGKSHPLAAQPAIPLIMRRLQSPGVKTQRVRLLANRRNCIAFRCNANTSQPHNAREITKAGD